MHWKNGVLTHSWTRSRVQRHEQARTSQGMRPGESQDSGGRQTSEGLVTRGRSLDAVILINAERDEYDQDRRSGGRRHESAREGG